MSQPQHPSQPDPRYPASPYDQPYGQAYDQPQGGSSYDQPTVEFPTFYDQPSAQFSEPYGPSAPTPAQPTTQFPQYRPQGWTGTQDYAPYQQQPGYGLATPVNPYAPQALAPYGVDPLSGLPYSDKSKLVAGLLQIFLGGLGIGRFYLGNAGMAIAQILVTFVTLGFGALWPLIDGIVLLAGQPRDRAGRPLRS